MEKKNNLVLPSVYILGFIADFGMSILLLSINLTALGLNATKTQIGWVASAYGISYCFMPAIIGHFTDKIPRKTSLLIATSLQVMVAIASLFILTLSKLNVYLASSFILCIILGIGNSFFWNNLEAFISEYTEHDEEKHSRSIAIFCIAWGFGVAFGLLLAGFLKNLNVYSIALITFVLYSISLFLVVKIIPEDSKENNKNHILPLGNSIKDIKEPKKNEVSKLSWKMMYIILLAQLIFAFSARMITAYFPVYSKKLPSLLFSDEMISTIVFLFAMGRTFYFIVGKYLPKTENTLILVTFLGGFAFVGLYFWDSLLYIVIALFFLGFLNGALYYIALVLILEQEKEKRSQKTGLFEAMVGFGSAVLPIFSAYFALISLSTPFIVLACFILFVSIIQLYLHNKRNKV